MTNKIETQKLEGIKQTTQKQILEGIVNKEIKNGRFNGTAVIEESTCEPCFGGKTNLQKQIQIEYNPEYEKENPGKIARVIRDITRHEINHKGYYDFKGCPRTLENHVELIVEPIAKVLAKKGYGINDIHYVANAFEDTILHDDLTKKFALEGQIDFWDDVGRHDPVEDVKVKRTQKLKPKFTDFYEAHVKLNLFLWGNKNQKKELAKYFKHSKQVNEVLQNFLRRTGLADLKQEINGEIVKDREAMRQFLNNEENWPKIAKIYAEEFGKLMQPGYALPLLNHSGKGTKGKEIDIPTPVPIEGNPFDKEMYKPEFKKKRMRKAYENDEGIPPWLDYFEALDLVYQNLAQKLNIKVETFTRQTSMPIYWYGKRPFDPDKDNLKHVTFGFDDKGKVELKKKRWHEDMPLEYKIHEKGFPEVRFCLLDTSGSMQEDPQGGSNRGKTNIIPWGDNSKYHYALLAWYGLLEYLKQNHLLKQTNISLANFGDETLIGQGLTEAKKIALKPQFGSTYIDLDKVKELFNSRGMLIFTISDGRIANWDSVRDKFIKNAEQHYYFHLQIGPQNETIEDLKKAGLYVEQVRNAEDLATKVIDLTDKLYREK